MTSKKEDAERRRGRPALEADEKGVQLYHRVRPTTRESLAEIAEATGEKPGTILDRLIADELERVKGLGV